MESLKSTYSFRIRFSEVDSMKVVWHGSYVKYLEDAREMFGKDYGISYQHIESSGCYAPIVEMSISYKGALRYGMKPTMTITYHPTEAAKMVFDYEIRNGETGELVTKARTVQVFTNLQGELQLFCPPFYEDWKKEHSRK